MLWFRALQYTVQHDEMNVDRKMTLFSRRWGFWTQVSVQILTAVWQSKMGKYVKLALQRSETNFMPPIFLPLAGDHGVFVSERGSMPCATLPPVQCSIQLCQWTGRTGNCGVQRCENPLLLGLFALISHTDTWLDGDTHSRFQLDKHAVFFFFWSMIQCNNASIWNVAFLRESVLCSALQWFFFLIQNMNFLNMDSK